MAYTGQHRRFKDEHCRFTVPTGNPPRHLYETNDEIEDWAFTDDETWLLGLRATYPHAYGSE